MERKLTSKDVERNICRELTEKFTSALEKGDIPWEKPWVCTRSGYIGSSGGTYGLLNTILLALDGHEPGEFVTYNELKARNGNFIPKADGSKQEPTVIVFRGKCPFRIKDEHGKPIVMRDEHGNPIVKDGRVVYETRSKFVLRTAKVWRVGTQVDCPLKYSKPLEPKRHNQIAHAEEIIIGYVSREGIKFSHDNHNRAFYRPSTDMVNVPPLENFKTVEAYYDTVFHELGHSTGAENRLGRDLKNVFGDHSYSKEELVAELTSAIIMHDNGWNTAKTDRNSEAYIQSWGKAFKSDPMLIEDAMRKAEKAVKLIYGTEE